MPTLRVRVNLSKKREKPAKKATQSHSLTQTFKNIFMRFINHDSLPYFMAPVIFLALMYLEWLYLVTF